MERVDDKALLRFYYPRRQNRQYARVDAQLALVYARDGRTHRNSRSSYGVRGGFSQIQRQAIAYEVPAFVDGGTWRYRNGSVVRAVFEHKKLASNLFIRGFLYLYLYMDKNIFSLFYMNLYVLEFRYMKLLPLRHYMLAFSFLKSF